MKLVGTLFMKLVGTLFMKLARCFGEAVRGGEPSHGLGQWHVWALALCDSVVLWSSERAMKASHVSVQCKVFVVSVDCERATTTWPTTRLLVSNCAFQSVPFETCLSNRAFQSVRFQERL
eukprot:5054135-Pleurochrysis_carterae.AAC.1